MTLASYYLHFDRPTYFFRLLLTQIISIGRVSFMCVLLPQMLFIMEIELIFMVIFYLHGLSSIIATTYPKSFNCRCECCWERFKFCSSRPLEVAERLSGWRCRNGELPLVGTDCFIDSGVWKHTLSYWRVSAILMFIIISGSALIF